MAIPDHKYIASTEMDLKLMATDGTLIGNYQTSQMAESKVVSEFTNGKADPTSSALGGGVVREVLQSAANDIQQRIQRDREFIVESLGGEVEEPEAAPAEEAQFVESVTERTEIPEGARVNIAVVDLEAYGISDTEVQALTNRLRVELFQTGRFAVVERDQMRAIMEEQDFQQTGCTTNECLVEVGQLLNVQQIIAGSISKVGEVFSIEVRVIDVLTGEIVNAAIVDVMGAISDVLTEGIGRAAARLAR
jgi:TolB-like protein